MSQDRHPVLENAVYALALLLALIVGYYGIKRAVLSLGASAANKPGLTPFGQVPAPPRKVLVGSPLEESVSELPPLQVSRTGHPRASGGPVPPPTEKKN